MSNSIISILYDPLFNDIYEYTNQGWIEGWMAVGEYCSFRTTDIPERFVRIGEL